MGYNTTSATVGVLGFNGKVLAVSGDGSLLLVSDPIANATYLYSTSLASRVATAVGGATAGTLTPDNQWSLSAHRPESGASGQQRADYDYRAELYAQ